MARIDVKGPITDKTLNALNHNLIELYNMRNVLQTQINDLVLDAGKSNQEVAQARGGHQVLADRLNETEQKIEDKHIETMSHLNETEQKIEDKKADKIALSQIAQSKRDTDVDIEMKDLSQGVREAMTGGSVAVVGEDSVGEINLKPNSVTTDKIHKNAGIKFPYLSDDTFDLDYFWDNKTAIVSGDVKNNPFSAGCQVINFRSRTTDNTTTGIAWITQIAVVYDSLSDMEFGSAMYRHMRVDEAKFDVDKKSDWVLLGNGKKDELVTGDMLSEDYAYKDYYSGDEYNLNDAIYEGNYLINGEVVNNPFGVGCALTVTRHKISLDNDSVWVIQDCVAYGNAHRGKRAYRIVSYTPNGEFEYASDWRGDVGRSDNRPLKILSIGNSYDINTIEYIAEISESADVSIKVGCLYISGGYLEDHADNIEKDSKDYKFHKRYYYNGTITKNDVDGYSVDDGLNEEEWDYIFLNQASAQSGNYDTFQPYLNDIISHVKSKLPNVKIALMPTWAYSNNFNDSRFDKYDNDQITMYNAILGAYKESMSDVDFDFIIPSGTAIQNARTDDYMLNIDDELTRDGYHLGDTGMYIAGLAFFKTFFGSVKTDWKPSSVSERAAYFANIAADNAVLNPFKVTEV